jgi:translation initiation factor 1
VADRRLVYSTEQGRVRPRETRPAPVPSAPRDGIVRIFRERAGRGGKTVTVVRGLSGDATALLGDLRRLCGTGGTLKDGALELQGDHRERVAAHLRGLGHRVKLAGG